MARSVSDRRSRSAFRCGAARRQHGFRRVGQLPPQPVNHAPTGRLLIVEVDADTGFAPAGAQRGHLVSVPA